MSYGSDTDGGAAEGVGGGSGGYGGSDRGDSDVSRSDARDGTLADTQAGAAAQAAESGGFDDTPYEGPGITNSRAAAQRAGVGGLHADGYERSGLGTFLDKGGASLASKFGPIGLLGAIGATAADKYSMSGWTHPDDSSGSSSGVVSEGGGHDSSNNVFGDSAPTQTTPATTTPAVAATGMRQYVWNPQKRMFELTNVGAGENPMGYQQGQTFQMAAGGPAPSGLAAALPARFVKGGGTGLSDSIPVKMDDGSNGRLANEEFVIPADVVSGLGGGSSEAGAKILYGMMERIRNMAHGSSQQIRPVEPGKALPA